MKTIFLQSLDFSGGQYAAAIDVPMVYMENPYSEIYISPNGILGFGERLPGMECIMYECSMNHVAVEFTDGVIPLQRLNKSAIAPFYAPVAEGTELSIIGSVVELLRRLTEYIHKTFADSSDFQTLQAMVVTWDGLQNKEQDGGATFQVSNHPTALRQTHYSYDDIFSWHLRPTGTSFIFRISGSAIEDPRENGDDYEYTNYDQTDYDGDERKPRKLQYPADCPPDPYSDRCPEGCNILTDERMCSRCVCAGEKEVNSVKFETFWDVNFVNVTILSAEPVESITEDAVHEKLPEPPVHHHPEAGGETTQQKERQRHQQHQEQENQLPEAEERTEEPGHQQVEEEEQNPQRISGSFEGVINGNSIDRTDLHTFITATDGNAYTAVSKIPTDLGSPFLILNPIGSIMGWLFADVNLHTFITATDGNAYTAVSKIPTDLGSPFLILNPIGSIMGWLFADVSREQIITFSFGIRLFNRGTYTHMFVGAIAKGLQRFSTDWWLV
ncbi:unnamed protein product [Strongylus vulgaris]|uniref:Nidogen G2 beta-barrel domain-containing protein n=1 Tax=Strongylus vulgaris TaxID=40348 RepID=A0A3P7IYY4_STRVU|nr:unnamed protein product [Strongylus vulgaris]